MFLESESNPHKVEALKVYTKVQWKYENCNRSGSSLRNRTNLAVIVTKCNSGEKKKKDGNRNQVCHPQEREREKKKRFT